MEGKSCHDIAIDKEDIRTLLEVHLLTCEKPVSGDGSEGETSIEGIFSILSINVI